MVPSTSSTIAASAAVSRRSTTKKIVKNAIPSSSPLRSPLTLKQRPLEHHHHHHLDEPFHITIMKVGSTLLLGGSIVYLVIMTTMTQSFSFPADISEKVDATKFNAQQYAVSSPLSSSSIRWDPYGIAQEYLDPNKNIPALQDTADFGSLHLFLPQAKLLRDEFADRYGGTHIARAMLQRGIQVILSSTTTVFATATTIKNSSSSSKQQNQQQHQQQQHQENFGLISLAQRLQHTAQTKETFRILVTGSSAAAAVVPGQRVGKTLLSPYTSILDRLMSSTFAAMGISLVVQNAAVESNTQFPWTWCMGNYVMVQDNHHTSNNNDHFSSIDVIVWDFADTITTTTSSQLQAMEAFLRHAVTINLNNQPPPLFIFRAPSCCFHDGHRSLLQSYVDARVLLDPILILDDRAAEPFMAMPESKRPRGFDSTTPSFGVGNGVKSRNPHSPVPPPPQQQQQQQQQQQELVAWLIAMRLLSALEWIAADNIASSSTKLLPTAVQLPLGLPHLPPPILAATDSTRGSSTLWMPLVWGTPNNDDDNTTTTATNRWKLTRTHCRTSFDTSISPGNLQDLIVSGSVADDDPDLLLRPKSAMYYNSGWVLDLDIQLKRDKRLQQQQQQQQQDESDEQKDKMLVDTKKAYYGVATSGTLSLMIPIHIRHNMDDQVIGGGADGGVNIRSESANKEEDVNKLLLAKRYVETLAVCEFTLTHRPDGCQFPKDVTFRVDGKPATQTQLIPTEIVSNVNNACVAIDIPSNAYLIRRRDFNKNSNNNKRRMSTNTKSDKRTKTKTTRQEEIGDDTSNTVQNTFGLLLEMEVSNSRIIWDKGPCSVAQVIWQTKEPPAM